MYNTKGKTQKVYAKNKPNLNLVPGNCVCVFPIEIVGGKTQVSNQGIMPNRKYYDKGSFLYWQEVFDGRSALKIQWEDSIYLEKPEGSNYYLAKPQVGKYYYGKPISNSGEQLEISEDASYEDFMSMKASQSVTLRFEYEPTNRTESWLELQEKFQFTLVDNDIYNLYLIPELCEEKLMYISDYQEYYDDLSGESKGCEITFSTLGDKIQKSGQAIEQYCSWSAPGEFAVKPKVIEIGGYGTTDWTRAVIYDPIAYYYPTPIKYLQVEQQGPALTSTIYALGRRQEWDSTNKCWKIGPSKFLLPYEFIVTQPNPLNRTSTPSKNFFCFYDEQVTMVSDANFLEWTLKGCSQPLEQVKNNGMISIGANADWVSAFDHKSNQFDTTTKMRKDYFDQSWHPLSYVTTEPEYDVSGSVYANSTMKLLKTDTMIDIMCKNAFIYNSQPIIPLSYYSTRPMYLRDIPLIGSIANFFKLGDIKLNNHTTSRKCSNLCFFGDADIMSMCANLNGSMGTPFKADSHVFPINFFGTNLTQYQKLGVNAVNTTFCMALTDKIKLDNVEWDTIYLGQSTYEDHTEEHPHYLFDSHQSLLANDTLKPAFPGTYSFIIDAVVVQSIFDGKIRISCYGQEENKFIYPQWTATILSNAAWENGNMRDWTNLFMLSNWEERFCVQEDEFYWPLGPHKKDTQAFVLDTNITDNFAYEWDGNYYTPPRTPKPNVWQDNTSINWPKATVQGSMASSTLNNTLYTHNVTYTDLGCSDKDDFIAQYGSINFNCDNSLIKVGDKSRTALGSNYVVNLNTGVYSYNNTFDICSVRRSGPFQLGVDGGDFCIDACISWFIRSKAHGDGTFIQRLNVTYTLGETAVEVVVKDVSQVTVTCEEKEIGPFSNQEFLNTRYYWKDGHHKEQFQTLIKLPKIYFNKRV